MVSPSSAIASRKVGWTQRRFSHIALPVGEGDVMPSQLTAAEITQLGGVWVNASAATVTNNNVGVAVAAGHVGSPWD